MSFVLGAEHREIIEQGVGPEGKGAFIRDLILTAKVGEETTKEEALISKIRALDAIIQEQAKELKDYRKQEQKTKKLSKAKLEEIARGYAGWIEVNTARKGVLQHRNYFKGLAAHVNVKPDEVEDYLFPEGLSNSIGGMYKC